LINTITSFSGPVVLHLAVCPSLVSSTHIISVLGQTGQSSLIELARCRFICISSPDVRPSVRPSVTLPQIYRCYISAFSIIRRLLPFGESTKYLFRTYRYCHGEKLQVYEPDGDELPRNRTWSAHKFTYFFLLFILLFCFFFFYAAYVHGTLISPPCRRKY